MFGGFGTAVNMVDHLKQTFRNSFAKKTTVDDMQNTIEILEKMLTKDEQQRTLERMKQMQDMEEKMREQFTMCLRLEKDLLDLRDVKLKKLGDRLTEKVDYQEFEESLQHVGNVIASQPSAVPSEQPTPAEPTPAEKSGAEERKEAKPPAPEKKAVKKELNLSKTSNVSQKSGSFMPQNSNRLRDLEKRMRELDQRQDELSGTIKKFSVDEVKD